VIRIHRRPDAPSVLLDEGFARRQQHEADIDSDLAAYSSGAKTLEFDRAIYAHKNVKSILLEMQHEKCAFCEAKPLHVSDGDVEHFRPKAAVRQTKSGAMQRPGYYWLAYEWNNLLFACERCNRRHKKNFFPLASPTQRARSPRDAIANEDLIFIDPSAEDPKLYIGFREHVPFAIRNNSRGRRTIKELGLGRPELNGDREKHLEVLKTLRMIVTNPKLSNKERAPARALVEKFITPEAEYSHMCQVALATLGGLPPPT
jgi:uncharacterized protein (TIGR02646 family)